jgi:hypothetical protein
VHIIPPNVKILANFFLLLNFSMNFGPLYKFSLTQIPQLQLSAMFATSGHAYSQNVCKNCLLQCASQICFWVGRGNIDFR